MHIVQFITTTVYKMNKDLKAATLNIFARILHGSFKVPLVTQKSSIVRINGVP